MRKTTDGGKQMNLIVAVDRKWGIGKDGQLLVHNTGDMKFFRTMTKETVVVMGRKTLESFPGQKPLKNRVNVVLTRTPGYQAEGCVICKSLEETLAYLKQFPSDKIFIIGGEMIYRTFLPYCTTAYVTWNDGEYPADTWFPNLDEDKEWELAERGEAQEDGDLRYEFRTYRRKV